MYEALLDLHQSHAWPLLLLGDFNEIINICDRRGQTRVVPSMRVFKEWIDYMHPLDLQLHGVMFTWRRNNLASRTDRALCEEGWIRNFPGMNLFS